MDGILDMEDPSSGAAEDPSHGLTDGGPLALGLPSQGNGVEWAVCIEGGT